MLISQTLKYICEQNVKLFNLSFEISAVSCKYEYKMICLLFHRPWVSSGGYHHAKEGVAALSAKHVIVSVSPFHCSVHLEEKEEAIQDSESSCKVNQ